MKGMDYITDYLGSIIDYTPDYLGSTKNDGFQQNI